MTTIGPIKDPAELARFKAKLTRLLRTALPEDKASLAVAIAALTNKYTRQDRFFAAQ
jgi:hypothetical protein